MAGILVLARQRIIPSRSIHDDQRCMAKWVVSFGQKYVKRAPQGENIRFAAWVIWCLQLEQLRSQEVGRFADAADWEWDAHGQSLAASKVGDLEPHFGRIIGQW